jgi:riboflavin transporter FmnP
MPKFCFVTYKAPKERGFLLMQKNTTKVIAGTGIFSAIALVVSLLEFPIFTPAPFLKLDFSLVFILLAGFAFGPISGITASLIKELFRFIIGSSTGGVGEIANFIITVAFIIVPTLIYTKKKGLKVVILTLVIGCVMHVLCSLLANRYVNFPLFMGEGAKQAFQSLWVYVLAFNAIKAVLVSTITVLVYKKISNLIKKF